MDIGRKDTVLHTILLLTLLVLFAWSFVGCYDLFTWVHEAAPAIIGLIIIIAVYRKFQLTNLVMTLIWLHAIILLIGAHYTYARMPLFNWIRDTFELSRNHYDRLGHIFQGFVPAMIARELLLRNSPLQKGKWLFFIVISICLGISAAYELLEWLVAVTAKDDAVAFLATQGDVWDTQKDMALCLIGATAALISLGRMHDKALKRRGLNTV